MPWEVVLTSDRGSFTDYGGSSVLGYVACMPSRLVPRVFMDRLFTPPSKINKDNTALYAPYALRKIEAILVTHGIKNVGVIPPEKIEKSISKETKIIGITTHDPLGLNPVSFKLTMLFGGGPSWTAKFFQELKEKIEKIKRNHNLKVIIGGPGSWELALNRPEWVDVIFQGEAEVDLPKVVEKILSGEDVPKIIKGRDPKANQIPPIINPARLGEVQVTRGCPRGCQFCSITPETFRSIPMETIIKEIEINLNKGGIRRVEFITDDIMLYGSQRLRTNHDAIVKLFSEAMKLGVDGIWFPHISSPAVKESPKTVKAISEIARYDKYRAAAPVVGLETGSERIFSKYMRAKAFPWTPREWKNIIIDSTAIMNENYIYPCYTMTIGYPEETEEDVVKSIDLVQEIIDHNFIAWIFPLPVIPMGYSYIRNNPFPILEKMPKGYWDLLFISWKYDLKITRQLIPVLTNGIHNKVIKGIINLIIDKLFSNIEYIFLKLKETKGRESYSFSNINLNNFIGIIKSIYWLMRLSFKPQ